MLWNMVGGNVKIHNLTINQRPKSINPQKIESSHTKMFKPFPFEFRLAHINTGKKKAQSFQQCLFSKRCVRCLPVISDVLRFVSLTKFRLMSTKKQNHIVRTKYK